MTRWWRSLGLRARATVAFGLIGLFVSVALATTTYFVVRASLVDQRQQTAQGQAFADARLTRSALRSSPADVTTVVQTIRGESGGPVVVRRGDQWFASAVAFGESSVPADLRAKVANGHAGRQLARGPDQRLLLVVGTPIAAVGGDYFEFFSLDELERTLELLRNVLVVGAAVTAVCAAVLGRFAAGRVVEPLAPIADAASRISSGELDTRLSATDDRDLAPLTNSFNEMADSLQSRIEREARFASDVSHELRSPLAGLRAALDIVERRRTSLPPGVDTAFDIFTTRLELFEQLVLELLEISRYDAHAIDLQTEPFDVATFVDRVLSQHETTATVEIGDDVPATMVADRRRLAQAFGNIITNADRYAGGLTNLTVLRNNGSVEFWFDDHGPGVDDSEHSAIFDRFTRGTVGRRTGPSSGTGLGLALTAAHVELHGGRSYVTDRPGGGARFVIAIPLRSDE